MTVSTLPAIRPLSGAASTPGPEAVLANRFLEYLTSVSNNALLVPEVPIGHGITDLLRLQFRQSGDLDDLHQSIVLSPLQDRSLYTLAAFRPNQRYTADHLTHSGFDLVSTRQLLDLGLISKEGHTYMRRPQLVDRIDSVVAYEFKITKLTAGLRQAALRRAAVTRAYLVTTGTPTAVVPSPDEFRRLGVGWLICGDQMFRRIGAQRSPAPRWGRLLALRAIGRHLER